MTMNNNGLLLIFLVPSGAGKGTVLKELLNGNDNMKLSGFSNDPYAS